MAARHPGAQIVPGSMMNAEDVAIAMKDADVGFLVTPIGPRGDMSVEIDAAHAAVAAATTARLRHLVYVSVIGIDRPTGVPILDAKRHVERILATSGIAWTSIRCGSYLKDVIDNRLELIRRRGIFVLPVARDRRFSFTCQRDVPRLVGRLLSDGQALNRPIDLIDPEARSVADTAQLLAELFGRKVTATGKCPSITSCSSPSRSTPGADTGCPASSRCSATSTATATPATPASWHRSFRPSTSRRWSNTYGP
ncbi:hypothetical protein EJK15_61610 [Nonomuraea basaltis]|nr:hypothetical protein EJK15_61610 [Nonomuraea basaltis]